MAIPAFSHLKSFNDFYKIVDVKKISESEPILDCNEHNRHYRIYLTAKEGEKGDTINASNSITISLVNAENSNLSGGGTRKSQDAQWNNGAIRITSSNQAVLEIPQKNQAFQSGGYQAIKCQKNKIVKASSDSDSEVRVVASVEDSNRGQTVIKFELSNSPSCQKNGSREECEISFKEDNNLKGQVGFKPKAYFYS